MTEPEITPLRWGILGCAGIGRKAVLPAMRASALCQPLAIASRDIDRARATARDFAIPEARGSYQEILDDPRIEAVYIPLPNHLHVDWTIRALEAGKDVLCEKPLALTGAEAARVAETAERTGRRVTEAFMTRHHPQWQTALALVQEGRIGTLNAIQCLFSYANADPENVRNRADIGGGGLYDIGCYAIDSARYFFGAEPERVCALADLDPVFGTDRLTSGLMGFAGGRHASFTVATQSSLAQSLVLLGSTGRIVLDAPFNCPPDHAARLVIDPGQDLAGTGREVLTLPATDQYRAQLDAFVTALRRNSDPAPALAELRANARALEALADSLRDGAPRNLPSDQDLQGA
ncbi:Gfo/Idh/MocA family oxidoreductase [Pseudooceanicola sp. CBS1P-1]|uniref:Gfo/Idh/MocA family oxidoreductase n=1 Tax=Pseudooceanicola albus TaxID=2692189 RepID=A0A6L7G7A5_9RHOB|nr:MULTISPECIES: Gfo/Idh/MocA family oxidoreductase [Pseudooceanicola]MBT9386155.1 Gfo/Idh/MocA family oxidoreductase [Pseudooceanicola endophyticus]MXN19428.1 gfo/Idh/MocA family oxidoreductase [Pseudooceanicola albus]